LQLFGDKIAARRLAVQIGVPVIEGTIGPTSLDEALAFFETLDGGAMMIKAVSGGGGRGMRAVRKSGHIAEAYARCRSEAKAAFGDDTVYVERLVEDARHSRFRSWETELVQSPILASANAPFSGVTRS
jgi:pyruvate carboxylase